MAINLDVRSVLNIKPSHDLLSPDLLMSDGSSTHQVDLRVRTDFMSLAMAGTLLSIHTYRSNDSGICTMLFCPNTGKLLMTYHC